jgi:Protein of unknown function (DUF4232)
MMRSVTAVAAAVLVSLVAGGCGSSPGGTHARVTQCPARALVLRPGTPAVPMTGEHAVMYALANRGPVTCTVHGYPQVVLYGANGDVLPFHYATGGGAYITSSKPATVVLTHGASAYVLVAKYRCDLGIARNATAIQLTLPAAHGGVFAQREAAGISGPAGLSYCRGSQHDPGQLVTVSPVEPTAQAASSLR